MPCLAGSRDTKVMLDTFDAITRLPDRRTLLRGVFAVTRERLVRACDDPADARALLVQREESIARGAGARCALDAIREGLGCAVA